VKQEIEKDIANGLIPFFVVGTVGTTNSASIDELSEIADASKMIFLINYELIC
jgi:aromatic-L-amino-acid/L-tryptophan decarboxylase